MTGFNKLVRMEVGAGQAAAWIDLPVSQLVPEGHTLVLGFISLCLEMPSGQKPNPILMVLDNNDCTIVRHYPVCHYQLVYAAADVYKSAQALRIILGDDVKLRLEVTRDASTGVAVCYMGLSGTVV